MKTRNFIPILIIIGYLLAIFSFQVSEMNSQFEINKNKPMQMVKLDMIGNTTITTSYEIENPAKDFDIFVVISAVFMKFLFVLPFAIAGIGLVSVPIGLLQTHLFVPPEGFRVLIFWIIAISTIPINYILTKNIPLWHRIPYIYVLAAIISGTPMFLNDRFGG